MFQCYDEVSYTQKIPNVAWPYCWQAASISKSGVQAEFHIAKLHESMTCESVLHIVCSISKPSVTLKGVLQSVVQKELQQPPFHT